MSFSARLTRSRDFQKKISLACVLESHIQSQNLESERMRLCGKGAKQMVDMEKAINGLRCCANIDGANCENCPYYISDSDCSAQMSMDALELLKDRPEIVRCKDCKYATMTNDGNVCKYCEMDIDDFGDQRYVCHDADWYCANGERRE